MRSSALILAVVLVMTLVLVAPAEAYRKRKGSNYKTPYWTKAPEDDLKVDTVNKVEKCTRRARAGDTVKVHYTGALRDGNKIFDSSVARGEPFSFRLGAGNVIPGWEQGLIGMCAGEKRRLVIPPSLAYGPRGYPPQIPPNAHLLFVVEMLEVKDYTPEAEPAADADLQ